MERPPLGTHRGSIDSLNSVTSLPLLGMVRGVPVGNRGAFLVSLFFLFLGLFLLCDARGEEHRYGQDARRMPVLAMVWIPSLRFGLLRRAGD
jgi:hypothetical protein